MVSESIPVFAKGLDKLVIADFTITNCYHVLHSFITVNRSMV